MAKAAVFCIPAHGHVNAQLALAAELVKKGEQVTYYTSLEFENKVKTTGARVRLVKTGFDDAVNKVGNTLGKNMLSVARLIYEAGLEVIDAVYDEVEKENYDYFVVDSITVYGKALAKKLNKPYICTVPVFSFTGYGIPKCPWPGFSLKVLLMAILSIDEVIRCFKLANQYVKRLGITWKGLYFPFTDYAELNISTTSRMFQFYEDEFPQDTFKFVGPMMYAGREASDFPMDQIKDKKVIYISHGTVYNKDHDFFHECIRAFGNTEYTIVVSAPGFSEVIREKKPENFLVYNYVPQLQLLPHVSLFITHGGMNSVHEGLYHGVPLLVTPQAGDQFMNGMRVRDLKAGIYMEKPTADKMKRAVKELLGKPEYKENAIRLGQSFREAGGVHKAVEAIIDFKKKKRIA